MTCTTERQLQAVFQRFSYELSTTNLAMMLCIIIAEPEHATVRKQVQPRSKSLSQQKPW